MATIIKVVGQITLQVHKDTVSTTYFYLLQPSTASVPTKPTTSPPPVISTEGYTGWSTVEPGYTLGDTSDLYTTIRVVYSDGSFEYTDPSLSSSYEAAKQAYNQAKAAELLANAVDARTQQFWWNSSASPNYPVGAYAASGIEGIKLKTNDSSTYGYNTYLASNKLALRYNDIDLTKLTTGSLEFYIPKWEGSNPVQGEKGLEITNNAITFYNPSTNNAQLIIGANGTLQSGNYNYITDLAEKRFSLAGTKIDLIKGDIITPKFRLASGEIDGINAGAYIQGTVEALDGYIQKMYIGTDSTNRWEVGNISNYDQSTSAALISNGTAFIQLGRQNTWRLSTDRIHTAWIASNSTALTFPTYEEKYWDWGIHSPHKTGETWKDKFLYIRNSGTNNTIQALAQDLDDDMGLWNYQFWIDRNGNVHAPAYYVGNEPLSGGVGSIAEKIINSDSTYGKGGITQPIYIDMNGRPAITTYQLNAAGAKGVVTDLTSNTTSTDLPTAAAVASYVTSRGYITSYKDEKVQTSEASTKKIYLSGTQTTGTSTGTLNFDSNVYLTTVAGTLHATTFEGSLSGTASRATADADGNVIKTTYLKLSGGQVTGPVSFGDSVTIDEATIGDIVVNGNASFTNNISANTINGVSVGSNPKFTDTTYTRGTATSGGTTLSLVNTGDMYTWNNKIGGSGTSGYLAKFNGNNSITSGPALGTATNTFLRNDGTWATPAGTTYSAGTGLGLSSGTFSVKLGYTTSGNNRAVQADSNGNLYVVQKDDNTWTAMTGATSSANGSVGYIGTAPPKDGYSTKYWRADGTWAVPPNDNTHYTTHLYVGKSNSTGNVATTATEDTYLRLFDNSTARESHKISGGNGLTITSNDSGDITFTSPNAFVSVDAVNKGTTSSPEYVLRFTKANGDTSDVSTENIAVIQSEGANKLVSSTEPNGVNVNGPVKFVSGKPETMRPSTSSGAFLRDDGTWATPGGTYSLPLAANGTRGGVQIGYTTSGKNYAVQLSSEKMYVNVPWTDTTYSAGTGLSLSGTTFSNTGVTGVKGSSESTYRTGQVNLTYANVGAIGADIDGNTQKLYRPRQLNGCNDNTLDQKISFLRGNRLLFLPADQIIIEKTTDGGTTWVDAGYNDTQKRHLFAETQGAEISVPLLNGARDIKCGLRITITGMKYNVPDGTTETQKYNYWNSNYVKSTERYSNLKELYFWVSTANAGLSCKVERATGASPNNWAVAYDSGSTFALTGWSGNDYVRFGQSVFGGGTTQTGNYWNYRFTFFQRNSTGGTALPDSYTTSAGTLYEIRGYGDTTWTKPNNFMANDHIYTWDIDQNVTFPGKIYGNISNDIDGNAIKTTYVKVDGSNKMTGNLIIRKAGTGANNWASRELNPSLIFEATDGQTAGLVYTQYDSVKSPDSITVVGANAGTYFIAPNIQATGNFYGNLSGNATNVTGTVAVSHGGTGATSLTSGELLIGNGTNAVTTRGIRNNTTAGTLGWTSSAVDTVIPTVNTIAYWNGAYQNTSSNLAYCNKGAFGTAATYTASTSVGNNSYLPTGAAIQTYVSGVVGNYVTLNTDQTITASQKTFNGAIRWGNTSKYGAVHYDSTLEALVFSFA